MVKLEVGKVYSTDELTKELGVSRSIFSHKKNEYLKSLSMAYNYEIEYIGRKILYRITDQIGEYQKPERKNARKKIDATIKTFINEIIDEDPMQTAANINRRAWELSNTNPSEVVLLGLKESTTGEYIRLNLREMYGTQIGQEGTDGMIQKKIWCKLDRDSNSYIEMKPELVQEFFKFFDEARKEQKIVDTDIMADYDNGLLTREEMKDKLADTTYNIYQIGKKRFYDKYGFYPIKVPVYIKRAWLREDKGYCGRGND